jgi:hypothetical protein
MTRHLTEAWDPTGGRHGGLPTYPWQMAPKGLATVRQLAAQGLRPGRQPIAAQILWSRYGRIRVAYLYRVDLAKPKRKPSTAQLLAIAAALLARQICPLCGEARGYYIPRRTGCCLTCNENPTTASTAPTAAAAA